MSRGMEHGHAHENLRLVVGAARRLGWDRARLIMLHTDEDLGHVAAVAEGETIAPRPGWHPLTPLLLDATRTAGSVVMSEREGDLTLVLPLRPLGDLTALLDVRTSRSPAPEDLHALDLLSRLATRALERDGLARHRMETDLRLAWIDQLKGDFAAAVSHELRTPLTVILSALDTVTAHPNADPTKAIELAREHAVRLADRVDTVLGAHVLNQPDGVQVDLHPVDVGQVVHAAVGRAAGELAAHHVVARTPTTPVRAVADEELLGRILDSLLANCAEHTPHGTVIEIEVQPVDLGIEVFVRDHGPGIPDDDLAHVSEWFFRGRSRGTRERGLGLGLWLVREYLALHGTEMDVGSEPGRGTWVQFLLPYADPGDDV